MTGNEKDRGNFLMRIAVIVVNIWWYGSLLGLLIMLTLMTLDITGRTHWILGVPLNLKLTGGILGPIEYLSGNAALSLEDSGINWIQIGFFPIGLLYLIVPYMLRKVVRSARDGNPFMSENVRRIRWIGSLIMLSGPMSSFMYYLFYLCYRKFIELPAVEVEAHLNIVPTLNLMLLGLLILVLAQVFDKGVRLQSDNDMTI